MSIDWKKLAPHKPIDPGGAEYVSPPQPASERIAQWISAGGGTVLLGGPVGIGKSTELAHATTLLKQKRTAVLVQLDRLANMQAIQPHHARFFVAWELCRSAQALGMKLSPNLSRVATQTLDVLRQNIPLIGSSPVGDLLGFLSPFDSLLTASIAEVSRLSEQRICLLVDGIEKSPEPIARGLFEMFAAISSDVELVIVVPWYAAFGPGASQVIQNGEKLVAVRAVSGAHTDEAAKSFFRVLLARRLSLAVEQLSPYFEIIDAAAMTSGGSPRTFLQLLADAATYARIRGHGDWPERIDLSSAFRDQVDSVRRLLLPGDKETLKAAEGTDGTEIDLGTRIRFLSHGFLFEQKHGRAVTLHMPPIVKTIVKEG